MADTVPVNHSLATVGIVIVPVLYLALVTSLAVAARRVPVYLHPVAAGAGIIMVIISTGWMMAGLSALAAMLAFVFLVYFAGRAASGTTVFTFCAALAGTPPADWLWLLGAVAVACGVAVVHTWRHGGTTRLYWIGSETLTGMGIGMNGRMVRLPNETLIPSKETFTATPLVPSNDTVHDNAASDGTTGDTVPGREQSQMIVAGYLLAGLLLATVFAVL